MPARTPPRPSTAGADWIESAIGQLLHAIKPRTDDDDANEGRDHTGRALIALAAAEAIVRHVGASVDMSPAAMDEARAGGRRVGELMARQILADAAERAASAAGVPPEVAAAAAAVAAATGRDVVIVDLRPQDTPADTRRAPPEGITPDGEVRFPIPNPKGSN